MLEHPFTSAIRLILQQHFGDVGEELLKMSSLLQYLNLKSKSAERSSKARASFANFYALYVLIEDYLRVVTAENYADYEGAKFSVLLERQRELPFGEKLQNHALNHRLNEEFRRYFPLEARLPILRDVQSGRYWINEALLEIRWQERVYILAPAILAIIEAYIEAKRSAFNRFISDLEILQQASQSEEQFDFIQKLLQSNVDARIFEIVSYAILKIYYANQQIYWGWSPQQWRVEALALYKTGRTNANDGGIDFVMKPLGRFFQVTETSNVKKYFLDIDKIQSYPLTFVIKSDLPIDDLREKIQQQAEQLYPVTAIVNRYMASIEEIINLPLLKSYLLYLQEREQLKSVIGEILQWSRLEFNYP